MITGYLPRGAVFQTALGRVFRLGKSLRLSARKRFSSRELILAHVDVAITAGCCWIVRILAQARFPDDGMLKGKRHAPNEAGGSNPKQRRVPQPEHEAATQGVSILKLVPGRVKVRRTLDTLIRKIYPSSSSARFVSIHSLCMVIQYLAVRWVFYQELEHISVGSSISVGFLISEHPPNVSYLPIRTFRIPFALEASSGPFLGTSTSRYGIQQPIRSTDMARCSKPTTLPGYLTHLGAAAAAWW